MNDNNNWTLGALAEEIGAMLSDPQCTNTPITHIAMLAEATGGQLSFFVNRQYKKDLETTQASAVILTKTDASLAPVPCLIMNNPYLGYAKAARLLNPKPQHKAGIHPSAWVSPDAKIDTSACISAHTSIEAGVQIAAGVYIGAGCVIETDVQIGKDSYLHPRITLGKHSKLGERVIIQSGSVIGSDGFGLANDKGQWFKIPQLGKVIIGNDVEIGANTTIDRGALGNTILENGVKLDNQIQIAHNVHIGAHTAIAGCVGIAGSAHIGKRCMIGGGVGMVGHIKIADDVHITGGSIVLQSIKKAGIYSSGTALQDSKAWHRNYRRSKQLDTLFQRVKQLEQHTD